MSGIATKQIESSEISIGDPHRHHFHQRKPKDPTTLSQKTKFLFGWKYGRITELVEAKGGNRR